MTTPHLLSADEYAELDEVDGLRDELLQGERILSPSPTSAHGEIIEQLMHILGSQLGRLSSELLRVVREAAWQFRNEVSGVESVPVPDLMVIQAEDARRARKSRWFAGVPLITVEVISPSELKARRLQKIGLYLAMGVPNVVEVDYTKRLVRVHTPEADEALVYTEDGEMTVPFRASIREIFSVLDED